MLRNRIFAGDAIMTVWTGLENGLPTADMSPWELAPTTQQQWMWPQWGQYLETSGESGDEIEMPAPLRQRELLQTWTYAQSRDRKRVGSGKRVAVLVDHGGRRVSKTHTQNYHPI